jgi:hypothetical protein
MARTGTSNSDPTRSCESIDRNDLERLGRTAQADLRAFFARNVHLSGWRDRVSIVALAQGAAEHYVRQTRGIWDLDIIVCFADTPRLRRLSRRQVVSWDWGPSKFGRCPYDPPEYAGRAVDVKYWVIPEAADTVKAVQEWLAARLAKHPDPYRTPDVAHEPVILIRPRIGEVVWDPGVAPAPKPKTTGHRKPHGLAPR